MTSNRGLALHDAYKKAGVDTDEATTGLNRIVQRIHRTWPQKGKLGAVQLPIGYFANVIDIGGGIGLGMCTDGVGSKAIIARQMHCYNTIGIDCVAMNVNDLICLGVRPLSMVDYIAIDHVDAEILDAIGAGLTDGAIQAGISISGGEIAQLKDVVDGFDLAGTAVGTVPLDKIITGRNLEPGDCIIGLASNGIHSNGLTLARKSFFDRELPLSLETRIPELGVSLGEELLRPTEIYVAEVMDIVETIATVKALVNVTSDGLLNLNRTENKRVGFRIDNMPPTPAIFELIQRHGKVTTAEMFEVYNMGVGFCVVVGQRDMDASLSILARHGRSAWAIGQVIDDETNGVYLTRQRLQGHGKRFRSQ
jgi:phosphoribosylformylglycinamidine cyclo-ligase